MEEFITAIQKNTGKPFDSYGKFSKSSKSSKLRNLLFFVVSSAPPEIRIIEECSQQGDIKFEVTMKDLGISFETYQEYKNEILSNFTASFIGELLVRENIDKFARILITLDVEDYSSIVNNFEHHSFGIKVFRTVLVFSFHISLLQSILLEDFKKKINQYE